MVYLGIFASITYNFNKLVLFILNNNSNNEMHSNVILIFFGWFPWSKANENFKVKTSLGTKLVQTFFPNKRLI